MKTLHDIKQHYGDPILIFQLIYFNEEDRYEIPVEVAVFKLDKRLGGCIVYSRYQNSSTWNPNDGERFVIDYLLQSRSDQFRERLEKILKCDCTNFWQKSHCTTCKEDLIDDIMDAYNEVHKT